MTCLFLNKPPPIASPSCVLHRHQKGAPVCSVRYTELGSYWKDVTQLPCCTRPAQSEMCISQSRMRQSEHVQWRLRPLLSPRPNQINDYVSVSGLNYEVTNWFGSSFCCKKKYLPVNHRNVFLLSALPWFDVGKSFWCHEITDCPVISRLSV